MQELVGLILFALISRDWSSLVVPVKVGSDPRNDPLSVTSQNNHFPQLKYYQSVLEYYRQRIRASCSVKQAS